MSVTAVRRPFSRAAGRLGLTGLLAAALVAGLMSGTAHAADDPGAFTPIDFSQAPPPPQPLPGASIVTGVRISGSFTLDGLTLITPPDIQDELVTTITFTTPGRPARGEAHLFSRTSGLARMTDAQYAGMVAMENDAVRAVMSARGISDNPDNHDLVIKYDREDTTVALYARLQQALQKDTPFRTVDEQQALRWLVAVAQAHAVNAATSAENEFAKWQASPCAYRSPAPYADDYTGYDTAGCRGLRVIGGIPGQDPAPSKERFLAWGNAAYDAAQSGGKTLQQELFTTSVSEAAIAFGAAGAFLGVATTAGLAAQFLTIGSYGAGALTSAVFPFFAAGVRIANALTYRIGTDAARLLATQAAGAAARFAGLFNVLTVLGPALIIAAAIVQLVLAGLDAFAARNTESALHAAADNARNNEPQLRELLGSTGGQQQVFGDLADSVIDCSVVNAPGECDIFTAAPTRRIDDPVFRVSDVNSGETFGPPSASAPISLGQPGAWVDTRLAIRDGWFTFDGQSEPSQLFHYTDFQGKARTAHLVHRTSGYSFQSLLDPADPADPTGSGYAATADCRSGNIYAPCFTSPRLPIRTSSGQNIYLSMVADHAPTAPVVGTDRPAGVGLPVRLASSLPAGAQDDPDGDAVTSTWSVEFDQPCVQSDPADPGWRCPANGATPDGPHGGYVYGLPAGRDTVVWNTAGTYRVTRTVTDPFGLSTSTSMDVVVAPAAKTLFATCLQCDTTGGEQVQIAGRIGLGAHRDGETVTVDWGDGTTTSGVPSSAPGGTGFLSQTFWGKIENSSQYQFQAVHTYAAGNGNPYRITVSATDGGDGNPPAVVLAADSAPVADPTSYDPVVVSDRLVDYSIPLRLPVFFDSAGNRPPVSCTAPDGSGGTRQITDFAAFQTGTSTTVTCRATAASGVTGTASFTVITHQITAQLVATPSPALVGQPVTYTATGTTDDGRDVGDISDRISVQNAADGVSCSERTCTRTTTAGPIVAEPMADDNHVGAAVTTPVTAGPAATVAPVAGAGQQVPVNTSLPNGISFVVRDAYGNPVPNTPVTLSVASGAGVLAGGVSTLQLQTDGLGTVLVGGAVGGTAGPVVFKATVNDDVVAQLTVTAFAGDGLRGVSGNAQRVRVGATPAPLVVRLYDGNPTPVPGRPIQVQVIRGPARFADGSTSVSGTTDGSGRFSAPLATAAAPGQTTFVVTSDGDSRVLTTYYVANAAPVATADTYTVTAGAGGLRPAAGNGVLSGDTDADGDALTARLVTRPRNGALTLAADGSFTYFPKAGFTGTDSFTYAAGDGLLTSAPQRVTLTVTPANADIGVILAGPSTLARGGKGALTMVTTNRGPSAAGAVAAVARLPAGLTFGAVPDGVVLSADKRVASYLFATLGDQVSRTLTLQIVVAAGAATGPAVVRASAGTALLPDATATNNTFAGRIGVT